MDERRKYPRADLAISLRTGPGEDVVRTVNLSAAGVAYDSSHWVEPLTRMEIMFVFPPETTETSPVERLVRVDAVVMRTEPEEPTDDCDRYRVACAFTSIQAEDQAFITERVERALAGENANA